VNLLNLALTDKDKFFQLAEAYGEFIRRIEKKLERPIKDVQLYSDCIHFGMSADSYKLVMPNKDGTYHIWDKPPKEVTEINESK
jgi:hypothetical protein